MQCFTLLKKRLDKKFIRKVQGVPVNFLTLKIYDETVQKDYFDHVDTNQFQFLTFVIYVLINGVNVGSQAIGFYNKSAPMPQLIIALTNCGFTFVWYMLNRYRRSRKYSPYIRSALCVVIIMINMVGIYSPDDSSFHQQLPFQDTNQLLTLYYFMIIVNFSYCQFKQVVLVIGPLQVLGALLFTLTYDSKRAALVHEILPPQFSSFVVPMLRQTVVRAVLFYLIAVVAKYHEEMQVIHLIISKWTNRNLNTQLVSLYKSLKDGLIIYNNERANDEDEFNDIDNLKIQMLNDAVQQMFDFQADDNAPTIPEEMLFSECLAVCRQEKTPETDKTDKKVVLFSLQEILTDPDLFESSEIVDINVIKDGAVMKTISLTKQKVLFNSMLCQVMSFRDITTQVQLRKAQEKENMKNLLVSSVTHEFLTPVRCIYNLTTILDKSVERPEDKKNVKLVQKTACLLLAQISMTLDGSLLEQNHFQPSFSTENVKNLIKDTVDLFRSQADIKQVKLKFICHVSQEVCKVDKMRVQQVFINLLSNAIKFSHLGTFVFITVLTFKVSDTELEYQIPVKDQGIGINAQDYKKLFTPFFKTTDRWSRVMNQNSHGIGLSVCRKIMQNLGGNVTATSEFGKGSTFTFSFSSQVIARRNSGATEEEVKKFRGRIQKNLKKSVERRISKMTLQRQMSPVYEEDELEQKTNQERDAEMSGSGSCRVSYQEEEDQSESDEELSPGNERKESAKGFDDFEVEIAAAGKIEAQVDLSKLNKILVADDQDINLEVLKQFFSSLKVEDVKYCIDGQIAIDACKAILDEAVASAKGPKVQLLSLVILDFQMPFKNGIQVVQEVRSHVKELVHLHPHKDIIEPRFVINSAFKTEVLKRYLRENKIDDCLEKPIPLNQLRELLIASQVE